MATDITVVKQKALDLLDEILLFNNEQTVEQVMAAKDKKITDLATEVSALTVQLDAANAKIATAIAALQSTIAALQQ
jgi:predicted  nucleic acid-binding Zn-ribbon protein